jgi:hypothetical protein
VTFSFVIGTPRAITTDQWRLDRKGCSCLERVIQAALGRARKRRAGVRPTQA